jgi:hypothetical protein
MNRWHSVVGPALFLTSVALVAACSSGASAPLTATPTSASTPLPSASPFRLPLSGSFTSTLYAYTINFPQTFTARAATEELHGLGLPILDSPVVDQLDSSAGAIVVGAASLGGGSGATLDSWTAGTARAFCGEPTTSEAIQVAGEAGTLSTFASCKGYFHQWVTMIHGGRGYHIVWLHDLGTETADRELFLSILATFEFGTGTE